MPSTQKKSNTVFYIILALGIINLALAAMDIISGNPIEKYMLTLFIGVTLTGTASFQLFKKEDEN